MPKKPMPRFSLQRSWRSAPGWIKRVGAVGTIAGAVGAIITTWHLIGAPIPAWSSDILKLDRKQTEIAAELYGNRVRNLLAIPPPADPVARQNWDEELRQSRQKLDAAEQRRIELSK